MNAADRYKTLVLIHPVEYGDQLVTELKIRRPQGKHWFNVDAGALETGSPAVMGNFLADLSGQPIELIGMLESEDLFAGFEVIGDFLSVIKPPTTMP